MDIIKELVINKRIRSDCYRLLAACFYYPQKDVFMEERLFENLTQLLKHVCPEAALFSDKMGSAILNYSNEDLLVDYSKLFVGPSELIAPPYGSIYLEAGKRVMGDTTMEVIGMYQKAGLSMSDDFKELPDHIAVELEFMSYLIFKEIEALKQSDFERAKGFIDKQEIFLNTFLRRWVPPFCEKIKEGTGNKFYLALADCVSTFIMNSVVPWELPT